MVLTFDARAIERVAIIDDDEQARESYRLTVEDLDLQPVLEVGPLLDAAQFIEGVCQRSDAALCDYHLRKRNYARFDGDDLAVRCYRGAFPAVLCTSYSDFEATLLRKSRREIPVLLRPDQVNPDSLATAWERCIEEFQGKFRPDRRPWRALIRVEEVVPEERFFYAVVPAWNAKAKVRLMYEDLPPDRQAELAEGRRFHAQVNTGAMSHEDLYFTDWEKD